MLKKIVPVLVCAFLLAGSAGVTCADLMPDKTCSLTIKYYESTDKADPVTGAVFTCYRVAGYCPELNGDTIRTVWRSVVKYEGEQGAVLPEGVAASDVEAAVHEAYRDGIPEGGYTANAETGKDGTAVMSGLVQGLYLIEETKSAPGYLKTAAFLASLPKAGAGQDGHEWIYDISAEPKPQPCGDLMITKTVPGRKDGEGEDFSFTLTLESEGTYRYVKSDKSGGAVKNGSSVKLKSGESVYIAGIPAGTVYRVTEKEADSNGYKTSVDNTEGRIERGKAVTAAFINVPAPEETPPAKVPGATPTPVTKITPTPTATPKITPTPTSTPKATPTPTETPSNNTSSKTTTTKTETPSGGTAAVAAQKSTAVKTGDMSGLTGWIVCFIISGAALIAMNRKAGI